MDKIRMVDLNSQYKQIKDEIDNEISKVLETTAFINGPIVSEFQKNLANYLHAKHVITCGNGTDALQIAMMALGLKPGDEVITSNFTFVATVETIALLGLTPILVDVYDESFNINIKKIEEAITPKTKAIIPVHLFGQAANMEEILNISKKHNLKIIEDTAQAIGSEYYFKNGEVKKLGTIGDIGCTSFFPSKNLGCFGDGGAIFTNNDKLAENLRSIVNHGMEVRYYHDKIGVNSRLDSIQAAILNVKLKHLDDYNKSREEAASFYDNAFKNCNKLTIPERSKFTKHIFHQYTLKLNTGNRKKLIEFLNSKNIPAMVYYPVPLHLQKAYKSDRYNEGDFPVTEKLCNQVFSLPMHTELTNEQLTYITNNVLEYLKNE